MSETTNLNLKKHDEPLNENTNQFNVRDYLNGNWDKIEDFAEQVNDKVIEIEDSIDLVKQRTEQAVEDINTDIEDIKTEQTEQNTNIQKNTTDILNLDTSKASKEELQEVAIALQAELLKAQEEIERQNKDYKAGTLEGQEEPVEEYPEFVQPTGSHNSYKIDDKITYNGKKYICKMDNCVWAPDVYPAGWEEVVETVAEENVEVEAE